jgi:hypothetical protein
VDRRLQQSDPEARNARGGQADHRAGERRPSPRRASNAVHALRRAGDPEPARRHGDAVPAGRKRDHHDLLARQSGSPCLPERSPFQGPAENLVRRIDRPLRGPYARHRHDRIERQDRHGSFRDAAFRSDPRGGALSALGRQEEPGVLFTVDDPKFFTTAWSGRADYRRDNRPLRELVCAENNQSQSLAMGDQPPIPTAAKPDF